MCICWMLCQLFCALFKICNSQRLSIWCGYFIKLKDYWLCPNIWGLASLLTCSVFESLLPLSESHLYQVCKLSQWMYGFFLSIWTIEKHAFYIAFGCEFVQAWLSDLTWVCSTIQYPLKIISWPTFLWGGRMFGWMYQNNQSYF